MTVISGRRGIEKESTVVGNQRNNRMEEESTVVDQRDMQERTGGEGEYSCRRSERQAGEEGWRRRVQL